MHLKEISFDGVRSDLMSLFGNCIEFVFQEDDDNTFWKFCFSFDGKINPLIGFKELFIEKYIIDDENEKHLILFIHKYCKEDYENLSVSLNYNAELPDELPDYYYSKRVDKNGVTEYHFQFNINGEHKTITINSKDGNLSKNIKNKIQRMIKYNVKNKWYKFDDFKIICKVPVDVHGYNVNGKFYKTLKQAATELNVSTSIISMALNERNYSSDFKVYHDMITEYHEEEHMLSYAILNMYDIVRIGDIKVNCNKINVKLD